jgi:predicted RNase H-like HicB family nuclease
MFFPVVIHKDRNSDYGVAVPDLPGCFSAGETLAEAIENVREAIELHIEGLIDDGQPVSASDPEVHQSNPDYAGGIWHLVKVDPENLRGTAQRINITVPERVLERIDRAAQASGTSRSGYLVAAALRTTVMDRKAARAEAGKRAVSSRRKRRGRSLA